MQPETLIKWHRKGFKHYWRKKSRSKPGRPPISMAIILLIRRMSEENITWGAPHIVDELALLGHTVADSTVAKYMVKHRPADPSQSWKTFLDNHLAETAACDFFVVPTITFQRLFCFVVMSLDRRQILHVNVTKHPTAEWSAQQLVEAFADRVAPRFLQRDRDGAYGEAFINKVKALGIEELISAPRSPWQNGYVERLIARFGASARTISCLSANSICSVRFASTPTTTTRAGRISRSMATRLLRDELNAPARSSRRPCSTVFITTTLERRSSDRPRLHVLDGGDVCADFPSRLLGVC